MAHFEKQEGLERAREELRDAPPQLSSDACPFPHTPLLPLRCLSLMPGRQAETSHDDLTQSTIYARLKSTEERFVKINVECVKVQLI